MFIYKFAVRRVVCCSSVVVVVFVVEAFELNVWPRACLLRLCSIIMRFQSVGSLSKLHES